MAPPVRAAAHAMSVSLGLLTARAAVQSRERLPAGSHRPPIAAVDAPAAVCCVLSAPAPLRRLARLRPPRNEQVTTSRAGAHTRFCVAVVVRIRVRTSSSESAHTAARAVFCSRFLSVSLSLSRHGYLCERTRPQRYHSNLAPIMWRTRNCLWTKLNKASAAARQDGGVKPLFGARRTDCVGWPAFKTELPARRDGCDHCVRGVVCDRRQVPAGSTIALKTPRPLAALRPTCEQRAHR